MLKPDEAVVGSLDPTSSRGLFLEASCPKPFATRPRRLFCVLPQQSYFRLLDAHPYRFKLPKSFWENALRPLQASMKISLDSMKYLPVSRYHTPRLEEPKDGFICH
jgi:hypothetical protein